MQNHSGDDDVPLGIGSFPLSSGISVTTFMTKVTPDVKVIETNHSQLRTSYIALAFCHLNFWCSTFFDCLTLI